MTEMAHVLKENYSITYLNLRNNACGTHLKGSLGNQLAGFGEFSRDPAKIAERVSRWIQDPAMLDEMATAARAAATPHATEAIASELCLMLDDFAADRHIGLRAPVVPIGSRLNPLRGTRWG